MEALFELPFYCFGDLGEARTLDPLIKSQLLYQLSYEVIMLLISDAKVLLFFELATILSKKITKNTQ